MSSPDGGEHDVAVLAGAPVRFGDVRAALDPHGSAVGWCSGGRLLSDTDLLGGPGLRSGDRLTRTLRAGEPAVRGVDVVGGLDAGRSLRGTRRTVIIGRGPDCDLQLRDPTVSRRQAQLSFTAGGIVVRDLGSTHGTRIGTRIVTGADHWDARELLRVGDTHLARSRSLPGPAAVRQGADGTVVVRPARRVAPDPPPIIELLARTATGMRAAMSWSAILVPALGAVGMAVWSGSVAFLAIALLSPLLFGAVLVGQRLAAHRRERGARAADGAAAAHTDELIAAALRDETTARRSADPDAGTVLAIARGPLDRLWERSRGDPDVLRVRLGLADGPSNAEVVTEGTRRPAGMVCAVPAVVDLASGPLGLVGPIETLRALARWLLAQLAVFVSPADLRIEVRAGDDAPWRWLRWLPHLHADPVSARTLVVLDVGAAAEPVSTPAICLAIRAAELPAGCTQIVTVANESGTRLDLAGRTVLTDAVGAEWAEQIARALAPLVPAPTGNKPAPPRTCRLDDVLGPADPAAIARRWAADSTALSAPVGRTADGPAVVELDRLGPHLLIAGTTGSGKSELLRTLVVSLSYEHARDAVNFVLIDYKGGSAFAECASLPHVTALVTDLDEHLTARALASLGAELRRRERLFAARGVSDLAGYRAVGQEPALPRLVIVVDEFATLAAELPDFVAGLTAVAQRGRSLGLHLVLATQRPAGVVTGEMRANCALRIALRVTEAADSRDVLEIPDAAAIPHELPGRAYLWSDGTACPVQIARSDLPMAASGVEVRALGAWRTLTAPASEQRSELGAYVAAITAAAAGRPPAKPPWLPPLPDRIELHSISPLAEPHVAIGVVDVPRQQLQRPLALDLAAGCGLLLAGAPRSGRTTALATIATAAANRYPPDELHIHAIDLTGALTRRLAALPHAGTLVGPAEGIELADALLDALVAEEAIARTVVLIDDWQAVARAGEDSDGGRIVENLLSLLHVGDRTIAIAGDRSVLVPRLSGTVTTRLLLRLPDRTDYAIAGIPLTTVPARMPPGRVLIAPDGSEAQLALPHPHVTAGARPSTALRLRLLPALVRIADVPPATEVAPFAVCAPRRQPVALPMRRPSRLLVAGPPRSGRSTTLTTLLHQAVRARVPVTVVAGLRSPVRAAAARLGVASLGPDAGSAAGLAGAVLVDDAAELADTTLDEALVGWARTQVDCALVVAARTDEAARAYRGVIAEVRRSRCALLLQPDPLAGEIVGLRLRPGWTGGPPGRGVLLGDPAWGDEYKAGPLRVQVALSEAA